MSYLRTNATTSRGSTGKAATTSTSSRVQSSANPFTSVRATSTPSTGGSRLPVQIARPRVAAVARPSPGVAQSGRTLASASTPSPTPASTSASSSPYARNGPLYTTPCEPAHDRPVLCLSVSSKHNMIVSGSADHGLRVFSLDTGRFERELFTRTSGHKEWVTTCSILEHDGRIISGGMDAAGCLWHAGTNVCSFFPGHSQSLTKVSGDDGTRVLTASMDGTLKMWDCSDVDPVELFTYSDHGGLPVTTFRWTRSLVVSADKGSASLMRRAGIHDTAAGGALHVWDTETGSNVLTFAGHPNSTVLAISLLGSSTLDATSSFDSTFVPDIVVSGGTDGYVRIWDTRSGEAICARRLSRGMPGAVTDICAWGYGAAQAERSPDLIAAEKKWRLQHSNAQRSDNSDTGAELDIELKDSDYDTSRLSSREQLRVTLQDAPRSLSYGRSLGSVSDLSIMCALNDGFISVLDPRAGFQTRLALVGHRTPVLAVQSCPDGEHVLSTSADGALLCHSMKQPPSTVTSSQASSSARTLASTRSEVVRSSSTVPPSSSGSGLAGLADLYAALGDADGPAFPTAAVSRPTRPPASGLRAQSQASATEAKRTESTIPTRTASWGMCVSQGPRTEEARAVVGGRDGGRAVGCLAVGEGWAVTAGEDGTPLILGFAVQGRRGNARAEWID